MRYWWVNQNQTFRHEFGGGYLWSPKRKKNNHRNAFYEFMREVSPGDVVFSFCDTYIRALGLIGSFCRESPKPTEFGTVGTNWSEIGWKIDVRWQALNNRIRPKDHIARLRAELPVKYAPLTSKGNGLQSVYLAEISSGFAAILFAAIGSEVNAVAEAAKAMNVTEFAVPARDLDIEDWEQRVEVAISEDRSIADTERQALVMARRGQGLFRANVRKVERACRITKVDRPEHLIASHAKPWRDSSNEERLDGENGLLLTPSIDHLFNDGFISFENTGRLIVSPVAHASSLQKMGIDPARMISVGSFSEGQRKFLEYHRTSVLRMAGVKR